MIRRNLLIALVTSVFALGSLVGQAALADTDKQRVVYHVADPEKVGFALNNIRNHINGMGGPDQVDIILVVHGPGLKEFNDLQAEEKVKEQVAALKEDGVKFEACGNTMNVLGVDLFDLVPGFARVDQGGVVRIAQLQQQGYLYIRP